ncbi:MAG: phospho-sugar mutase [Planctomycetaceae bacterium]|nr:phospho-sugar mutase [Planctomycetaceae bacterium]
MSEDSMSEELMSLVRTAAANGLLTSESPSHIRDWMTRASLSQYRQPIEALIRAENWQRLDELFWTAIPFGTGGRRGPMGDMGPATINDRTIAESAHGMAAYLRSTGKTSGGAAVIAHDTRNNSPHFARITACTLAAHGLTVYLFESHRSTPELSYAVRRLNCDVGVMISASHNPPADNGFKAYWSNGGQVIAPHDKGIIAEVERADVIPTVDYDAAVSDGRIVLIGADVDAAYIQEVVALSQSANRNISAVFTPLHGVGETSVYAVIRSAGFDQVDIFEPHRTADGNFPNVPKHAPNPENLEVFDPVIEWINATGHAADLILASDPDADRLGVMVRNASGGFTPLSGNQVGALLTDYLLRQRKSSGRFSPDDYVVETLVTTPLTTAVAKGHGARAFNELLVGFKYIAQTMEEQGTDNFVFGTEESIGFLAGAYCRDKDAAVCGLFILELAAELKAAGRTLLDQLDDLYSAHGYHCEGQVSIYCEGPTGKAKIDGLMQTLRNAPPAQLASVRFTEVSDYQTGTRISIPDGTQTATIENPRGDLLFFRSDASAPVRIQIAGRPSGTEPKIKFYFFCQSDLNPGTSLEQARSVGDSVLAEVRKALSGWADQQLNQG